MMMLQYSTRPEASTIFQSFVGAAAKGEGVVADSVLSPGTGPCLHASSEKGSVTAPFSTAAGWCPGAKQPAAERITSKFGDIRVSLGGLHSLSRGRDVFPEEQDRGSSDQLHGTSMFLSGGAPPPPGPAPQQLQQHTSAADALDSNVHMGRLLNTRLRQAVTTAPGSTPQCLAQGNIPESGCKQITPGPYSRTNHPPHDVHSRKRRQAGILHGGGDAESEDAVSGGRAHGDQSVRAYPAVRKPFKHARGASRTRFDSSGDGRDARREGGERQGGPGGPGGLPTHLPNCGDAFNVWGAAAIACQPQPSPPPPPDDNGGGAKQKSADSSNCRQLVPANSGLTNTQASGGERRGGGRSWRGPSPGRCAPPPPPQTTKAVLRSCYSDQIIDNSRGLPCFKRLKAAFVSVAEVAGHPDLILPRYLSLTKKLSDVNFHSSSLPQCVPLPPSAAADGSGAQAGGTIGDRRGLSTQGDETGGHSHEARGAKTTAPTSNRNDSSSISSGDPSIGVFGGWKTEALVDRKACVSAEPVSSRLSAGTGEIKHPPWSGGAAKSGRQQIMQEEMSEVSSVDSDDDEMEDGEVAEEAARVQTYQQQDVAVKGPRLSRTDAASSGGIITSTAPACVPPWISAAPSGLVSPLRSTSQQQEVSGIAFSSRSDPQLQDGQPSVTVLNPRREQQQELTDTPSRCGAAVGSLRSGSTSFIGAEQGPPEALDPGTCSADGEPPDGGIHVQQFSPTSELKAAQQLSHVSKGVDGTSGKSYAYRGGVVSAVGSSCGLQSVRSSSSSAATARPPEASTGGTVAQLAASPRSERAASEGRTSAAHAGSHVPHSTAVANEAQATTGSTSCVQKASCTRTVTSNAMSSTSAASSGTAKPRPVDPRLTRQPKLQAGQHGNSTSGGVTLQEIKCSVNASANTVDVGASSTGKAESVVERKGQAAPVVPLVQPPPPAALTSVASHTKSNNTSSAFAAEAQAEPPRYYVCSIDGSRVELKPPKAPVRGTLPESLANTCVARGKLPLLLDLDNTLLHAQAATVTGCDVRLQDWLDEKGEPELFRFELSCNRKSYYMKLRPHLRTFLRVLEPYYEMSVYTNATQEYADIVVAILDENRQLFSDRIVARNSGFRGEASENKAVRRMYENMDKRCIVAFDDRQNIWTDLPLSHVVKAQHYDFFDSHRAELNAYYPPLPTTGSNGCGLSSIDALGRISDEIGVGLELGLPDENEQHSDKQLVKSATSGKKPCDWDKHLDCMLKLFLHIHTEFFRDPAKANIGAILSTVQQGVLAGVGIFFTGYRKTYSPGAAVADCEERQAELAQRLGAKVYKRFDEDGVTHVVAGKNNTNNMLACRENTKLSRVHTLWLYCCEAALTRVPEAAFEADALCAYYENCPPTSPYRDHWIHLAQRDRTSDEKVGSPNSSKAEIATGSKDASPWLSAAHQHHPLPPQDSLPVREFLGTGPYSDGATLTSPYEEIVFIWRPDKQTVRQLYGEELRGAAAQSAPGILTTGAPFGSLTSNTGVLLAPVKPGLAGGTSSITSSGNPMGHPDVHIPGVFGERPVEASVSAPSLHAAGDEGLLESRRANVLVHSACAQMHMGLPL